MKRIVFVMTLLLLIAKVASAQSSNAILFTENGEKFTAILNGVRQNDKPETNVKITGLNAEFYKLKVIFEDPALGERNMNLYINPGSETSYSIRKNNKGEYVLRLISEVPVAQAPSSTPYQSVVVYHANPAASPQNSTVTHTTTTTTTTHGNPDNVNVNMGVNVGGDGGSLSIQASGMDTEEETTVTQTTTTHSSTNSGGAAVENVSYLPGYSGPVGCHAPIAADEFRDIRSSISSKTFEDTRMTIAKQVLNDRCILASQVKEIMLLFTFEENRLDFAKYAYDKTYDVGNYFKVNDAFTFESSVNELNQYISSGR
jgi:hypothetical protein